MRMLNPKGLTLAVVVVLVSFGVMAAARGILVLSQYPVRQAAELRSRFATVNDLQFEERVRLETTLLQYETDSRVKIWTVIVQAAGGAALLLGLLFTARNLQATREKLEIDREANLTNRLFQATGQLGAEMREGQPNVAMRLGGIYALNRISKNWKKEYWPIAEVLTAYVRDNTQWSSSSLEAHQSRPRADVQAILTFLGRQPPPEPFEAFRKLDFRNSNLQGAEFWDARLEWADFWGARLDGAYLWGALLRHAKLEHAHLVGANLRAATLEGASLEGADVTGALFDRDTVWPTGFDARGRGAVFIEDNGKRPRTDPPG